MQMKRQFQSLMHQQTLANCAEQPTEVQPAAIASGQQEIPVPDTPFITSMPFESSFAADPLTPTHEQITDILAEETPFTRASTSPRKRLLRAVALVITFLLFLALVFTWHFFTSSTTTSPTITQQNFANTSTSQTTDVSKDTGATSTSNTGGTIQVYILGAVKHPGVYTLPTDARVYQLVQDAGGTLSDANIVVLNLAAKLTDGEEIYVLSIGETPPTTLNSSSGSTASNGTATTTTGQLVNINTATETQMEQTLHVSATTAKNIIAYRTQHGPYTATSQLLQAISQSIYDRIKNMVTV